MKQLVIILLATLMLIGCRAKQTVINETQTASLIDTTHTVADTMSAVSIYTDTTTATQHVEQSASIEFVDGGGTVSIDTAGNVTIKGVKTIKGVSKSDVVIQNGITERDSIQASHTDQANGITKNEAKQTNKEEKVSRAIQWWERPLIWIGALCGIAAILWVIFIYIHKKF